jgi:cytochrome c oxidase subunit I
VDGRRLFFLAALVVGGLDTGWTFYTPYSTQSSGVVVAAMMGVFILGFSSIFTGLNFIVTINTMRPPGMTWFKMPLFLWALYATAIIQLLATPVLAITVLLLAAERLLGIGIFDPNLGGDPILFQHFFWFYSHPAVYIMILPAMGIISELMSVFSRKHIFGYRFIAYSSVAIALLGFLVWGHHMFVSGQSALAAFIFSALTFSVSIPSGIKVFNWLATMYKGSIRLQTPMCYALSFLLLFGIGGFDRVVLGRVGDRRASARHVFRGGPLPLRDDGRHVDRLSWAGCTTGGPRCSGGCTTKRGRVWAACWCSSGSTPRSCLSSCWAAAGCRGVTRATRSSFRDCTSCPRSAP